ncbi:MAG: DHH family phosphoesterase [bacterium]
MLKKWQIAEIIPEESQENFSGINPIISQFLYNRGILDKEMIRKFLHPSYADDLHDPFLFRDMGKAVQRILSALCNGEKITIFGDYDADGVTSTILMEKVLRKLWKLEFRSKNYEFPKIDVYIPHRGKEGYGLNKDALKYIKDNGTGLIITVDCGVSNFEEVDYGNSLGMDIIITDHHQPQEKLPNGYAILNPKIIDDKYPFYELAGVGVAFKLAQGLITSLKFKGKSEKLKLESIEKWLLDLVAVGTVADCCKLIDENRVLVKYGLLVLNKTKNIGLKALIDFSIAKRYNNSVRCFNQNGNRDAGEFGISKEKLEIENLKLNKDIDAWNVAFQIAPRINAAGRLGHANTAYELLSTDNEEKAQKIACDLDETNNRRQVLTEKSVKEAIDIIEREQKDKEVFFVYQKHWEQGILGLIAGKICERYYKPVFAFTKIEDEVVASGRSIAEFNMIEALREMENGEDKKNKLEVKKSEIGGYKKYLKRYGGHSQACGASLMGEEFFEGFKETFLRIAEKKLKGAELYPKLNIDAELDIKDISWDLVDNIKLLEPFGENNPKPLLKFKNLKILDLRIIGNGGKHLKMKLGDSGIKNWKINKDGREREEAEQKLEIGQEITIDAVGFSMNDEERLWGEKLKAKDAIDIAGYIEVNEWNGNSNIQIKIVDIKKLN